MLRSIALALLLTALLALTAGCGGNKKTTEIRTEPSPMQRLTAEEGWRCVRITGLAVVPGYEMTLQFREGGMVTGGDGLNTFVATYRLPGASTLEISDVSTTRMGGPPDVIDQEMRFASTLRRVDAYRFRRGRLELLEGRKPILALRPISTGS